MPLTAAASLPSFALTFSQAAAAQKELGERQQQQQQLQAEVHRLSFMLTQCGNNSGGGPSTSGPSASVAAAASLLRTDKTSVVADAIRLITALRAENGQLKQLNKFMEQRLASVERERAELMMRAAYAAGIASNSGGGGNGNGNGGAAASGSAAAAAATASALPSLQTPSLDAAAAVAMLPPPWLPSSDLDTSLDGSKRPPAA